jgi:hypothetical protein
MRKVTVVFFVAIFAFASVMLTQPVMAEEQVDMDKCIDDMGGFTSYYKTHPTTIDQMIEKWGQPVRVIKSEQGIEKWVFPIKAIENDEISFIVYDGKVVGCGH